MKIIINLILVIFASSCMFGCSKKEPKESTETVAETAAPVAESQQAETKSEVESEPATEQSEKLTTAAPLKGLEWIKGDAVTFEPGKVYVVEFWATWCGPCKVSIPHLTEIQKKYKDKGVTIIGISDEEPETVKPFVKKMGDQMDYTVAVDVKGDVHKNYMEAFKQNGIPHAFIVDGAGKIAWNGHPLDNMETVLDMMIAGNFSPAAYAKQKAEAEALQQKIMSWYMDYFKKIEANGLTEETNQLASDFIEKAPADGLNAFAWTILNRVEEPNRDIEAALKAAQKAYELTEGKDPSILDTYALALFTNGKISEAVEAQQKAIDAASDYPEAQKELRQRLEEYKAALGDQI